MVTKHGARRGTKKKTSEWENRKCQIISRSWQTGNGPRTRHNREKVLIPWLKLCYRTQMHAGSPSADTPAWIIIMEYHGIIEKESTTSKKESPFLSGSTKRHCQSCSKGRCLKIISRRSSTLKFSQGVQESLSTTYKFNKNKRNQNGLSLQAPDTLPQSQLWTNNKSK